MAVIPLAGAPISFFGALLFFFHRQSGGLGNGASRRLTLLPGGFGGHLMGLRGPAGAQGLDQGDGGGQALRA